MRIVMMVLALIMCGLTIPAWIDDGRLYCPYGMITLLWFMVALQDAIIYEVRDISFSQMASDGKQNMLTCF